MPVDINFLRMMLSLELSKPSRPRNALASQGAPPSSNAIARMLLNGPRKPLPMEGRYNFLPLRQTDWPMMGNREWAVPGAVAGAVNALTAPGRALFGSNPFNVQNEALNFAGNVSLDSYALTRAMGRSAIPRADQSSVDVGMGNSSGSLSAEKPMRLYRAHTSDDLGTIKKFTSWSPDEDVALAYTDNPGFGGPNVRFVDIESPRVLDVGDIHSVDGKARLAEELGYADPYTVAQEWQDYGYRYPWEESKKVADALSQSGYDFIRYEDDYPAGATTMAALKDFAVKSK